MIVKSRHPSSWFEKAKFRQQAKFTTQKAKRSAPGMSKNDCFHTEDILILSYITAKNQLGRPNFWRVCENHMVWRNCPEAWPQERSMQRRPSPKLTARSTTGWPKQKVDSTHEPGRSWPHYHLYTMNLGQGTGRDLLRNLSEEFTRKYVETCSASKLCLLSSFATAVTGEK